MKFKCRWCEEILTPPRPHIDVVDQDFNCRTCGAGYTQQLVRQVIEREKE